MEERTRSLKKKKKNVELMQEIKELGGGVDTNPSEIKILLALTV